MHRDGDGETVRGDARFEQIVNPVMIGMEDLGCARFDRSFTETPIAGDDRVLAHRDHHEVGGSRGAIAIDHEPRVLLQDQGRIEPGGESARDPRGTDVPRDMAFEIGALATPSVPSLAGNARPPCSQVRKNGEVPAGRTTSTGTGSPAPSRRSPLPFSPDFTPSILGLPLETPARAKRVHATNAGAGTGARRRRACRAPDCFRWRRRPTRRIPQTRGLRSVVEIAHSDKAEKLALGRARAGASHPGD